jgi:hypothetical protein
VSARIAVKKLVIVKFPESARVDIFDLNRNESELRKKKGSEKVREVEKYLT